MAAFDSTAISGIATAAATVAAAVLLRVSRPKRDPEDKGVSLTKELMDQQRADFRSRIRDLERETRQLRAERDHVRTERDQLQHEVDFLNARNRELGGP